MEYIINTNGTDAEKPCDNYRCKQEANPVCAIMLKGKQAYQYHACSWKFYICQVSILKGSTISEE